MSITDELRKEARGIQTFTCMAEQAEQLLAIADRIDAEHERVEQDLIDANNQMEQLCECSVELPKDADGEYIHVGDVMEYTDKPTEPLTVSYIELEEKGWWVFADGMGRRSDKCRHYHAPTVEDVLREFALAVCKDDALTIRKGVVEEYAKRLKLAEGEDA